MARAAGAEKSRRGDGLPVAAGRFPQPKQPPTPFRDATDSNTYTFETAAPLRAYGSVPAKFSRAGMMPATRSASTVYGVIEVVTTRG